MLPICSSITIGECPVRTRLVNCSTTFRRGNFNCMMKACGRHKNLDHVDGFKTTNWKFIISATHSLVDQCCSFLGWRVGGGGGGLLKSEDGIQKRDCSELLHRFVISSHPHKHWSANWSLFMVKFHGRWFYFHYDVMGGICTYMQEVWSNCMNIFFEEKVKMQKWLLTGAFPL